jgi:diacylglycerol kinase (ATP)
MLRWGARASGACFEPGERQRQGGALKKTAFIVNSIATSSCTDGWRTIHDYVSRDGYSPNDVMMTQCERQATQLAWQAVRSGYEMVVAVGGDGTVNEVVNGLFENGAVPNDNLVLGVIPLGSGCDLARSLRIPSKPADALSVLEGGQMRRIDVGRADFVNLDGEKESRFFVNIADLGGGGLVVQKANRAPRIFGRRPNYLWGILTTALTYRSRMVDVSIDGCEATRMAVRNLIIANGRYFGRGFLPAPEARMDDGLFDIVNVGDLGTLEGLRHVPKLYKGTHLGLEKVSFFRGRKVEARSDEEVLLEMDGELVGRLPASFEIIPDSVNITAT